MNEFELPKFAFMSISLMEINNKKTLILMCKDEESAIDLYEVLSNNRYNVKAMVTTSLTHKIAVEFIDINYFIGLDTKLKTEDYPKFSWLTYGLVVHLTVGYRLDKDNIKWLPQLLPLRSANLN